jgi:hypothetical protein
MIWATYASIKDALVTQVENLQKLVNAGIGNFSANLETIVREHLRKD